MHMVVYEEAPTLADLNPSAPAELQRIVRRCLAKDAEERYQAIKDVAIELKELRREMKDGADFDRLCRHHAKFGVPLRRNCDRRTDIAAASGTPSTRASSAEYLVNGFTHRLLCCFCSSSQAPSRLCVYRFVLPVNQPSHTFRT